MQSASTSAIAVAHEPFVGSEMMAFRKMHINCNLTKNIKRPRVPLLYIPNWRWWGWDIADVVFAIFVIRTAKTSNANVVINQLLFGCQEAKSPTLTVQTLAGCPDRLRQIPQPENKLSTKGIGLVAVSALASSSEHSRATQKHTESWSGSTRRPCNPRRMLPSTAKRDIAIHGIIATNQLSIPEHQFYSSVRSPLSQLAQQNETCFSGLVVPHGTSNQ